MNEFAGRRMRSSFFGFLAFKTLNGFVKFLLEEGRSPEIIDGGSMES